MANEALGEGKCVVIGLQSTGDSRTKQMVQRRAEEDEEDDHDVDGGGVDQTVGEDEEVEEE